MGKTALTLVYILGASVALVFFTFLALNWYTDHGDYVVVPGVKGNHYLRLRKN